MRSAFTVKHVGFVALSCALLTSCALLSGCASTDPVKYSGIASSGVLQTSTQDSGGRIPFDYAQTVEWRKYRSVIIDPVVIYRGSDQQFGSLSEADKTALAAYMQQKFADTLRERFMLSDKARENTLQIRLTLTGAETNMPFLATATRFDIGGGVYNAVQNVRDRQALIGGSVSYAVEIYDATDQRLLKAFITKQFPKPWDIGASIGALSASRAGIDKGADALVLQLR